MGLKNSLKQWNGKDTHKLAELYELKQSSNTFIDDLCECLKREETERGASWLLKYALEQNMVFSEAQQDFLIDALPDLMHWEAKLHILQSMPYMTFKPKHKAALTRFIEMQLAHENKFVRAWAYSGLAVLRDTYHELAGECEMRLKHALENETAASVKARIRQVLK